VSANVKSEVNEPVLLCEDDNGVCTLTLNRPRQYNAFSTDGENISSIEVGKTLYRHPAVMEAAVIARSDEKWGEIPCAFITLKDNAKGVDEKDIIDYCRDNMAHFKAPKMVIFGSLPKTSTGKIQKFVLRQQAEALSS
jgi:fatty-acyl-CoA synthase